MNLHTIPSGPIGTNGYLLTAPERGEAVLIDAPGDILDSIEPILRQEHCRLTELWITHGHWDHMQDGAKVVRATKATVSAHPADRPMLATPAIMRAYLIPGVQLESLGVDRWVTQDMRFSALGQEWEVRHVPGHCPGNVLYFCAQAGVAFVGDALFAGSVGRTDLPEGSFSILENAIQTQIYTLPDATVIYPGHGPETTVGEEKANNPYVSAP